MCPVKHRQCNIRVKYEAKKLPCLRGLKDSAVQGLKKFSKIIFIVSGESD